MTLESLQHLIRSAATLAGDVRFIVLGSASLLASFPELGEESGVLAATYDADLCPDPFDELTGLMLHEALGEDRAYFRRHGYHADILKDSILDTLPQGWRDRLIEVPGCPWALALEPNDLAAVKLLVGRSKDLELVRFLGETRRVAPAIVLGRVRSIDIPVELLPRVLANFRNSMEADSP